jgi:predicted MPP superfamily phosphohydrolase
MLAARIVFFTLMAAMMVAVHVYLYRRLIHEVTDQPLIRRSARLFLAVMAVAAIAAAPVARFLGAPPLLLGVLFWVGLVLYLLLVLVSVDGARWVLRLASGAKPAAEVVGSRRKLLGAGLSLASTALAGGVASYGTWRAFEPPVLLEVPVRLPGLPKALDGFRIAHLTDIHVGAVIQQRFMDELVARTNAVRPDLVAMTGDLVDGTVERLGAYVARLRNLKSRHGTYFVTGNHDYYSGAAEWTWALQGLDIEVLRNRSVRIGDSGAAFDLFGVDDWRGDYDLQAALAGRDDRRASVLLAHQPANLQAVAEAKIGLQLSGHTHGGQIFPGTALVSLIWGDQATGLSRLDETQCFVSRGAGFVGPPMRVGAPPELPVIVLLSA